MAKNKMTVREVVNNLLEAVRFDNIDTEHVLEIIEKIDAEEFEEVINEMQEKIKNL